ncbi:MAG: cobalamin biosynthesis protein CobW [Synechococcaceae cyanobacterium SM2_3_1]|nr:cobalamin biosynthesis protein CobW [Synechococcaceae cyanobacterium SM2_3_1]
MHKIPVTVITGFLGAGKTTLIRHLLQHNQGRRLAVMVNEFGDVGIDGELIRSCQVCEEEETPVTRIVELSNGCLCCTVQEEFLPTMQSLLQHPDPMDALLIETSGLALPKPLLQAFRWPEIRTRATVDSVVTVVDCEALARGQWVANPEAVTQQRQADPNLDHETPLEELFADQLNCADLVLLTKVDQVTPGERDQVETALRARLPAGVRVIPCQRGRINADLLLGFNAAVEDHLQSRPSHHDHADDHEHDEAINAVSLNFGTVPDPQKLLQGLQALAQEQSIYRVKGFVAVGGKPMRMVMQGVGQRFESFYDRRWQPQEQPRTQLILIGEHLDRDQLLNRVSALTH